MSPASEGSKQLEVSLADFIRQKSPKKKRNSPIKRKYDSVSSFRGLLDRDSDSSIMQLNVPESGNESDAQCSLSTAANLLNQSERGTLNLTSQQSSARGDSHLSMANKRYPQGGNGPDLLPIDEDVDDEKCSPIKPVKRGKGEDSPFKRKLISL